jgi:hypothetical protein
MKNIKTYVALVTSFGAHTVIYHIRATSVDHAIEQFCLEQFGGARTFKNNRWRWGNEFFDSAKKLLAKYTEISFELHLLQSDNASPCQEVFCGIDWMDLFYSWNDRDFYMLSRTKVGRMYEWYSKDRRYYALFSTPKYISKRAQTLFGDALTKKTLPHKKS